MQFNLLTISDDVKDDWMVQYGDSKRNYRIANVRKFSDDSHFSMMKLCSPLTSSAVSLNFTAAYFPTHTQNYTANLLWPRRDGVRSMFHSHGHKNH
jgi:hypothetical protein